MSSGNSLKRITAVLFLAAFIAGSACGKQSQASGEGGGGKPEPVKMSIRYISSNTFEIRVPQPPGNEVLVHRFVRQYYSNTLAYGESQHKTLVCADVWYPNSIYFDGEPECIQGNLNFIYLVNDKVAGFENEGCHVGAGHGCEIKNSQLFYADGEAFDPSTNFGEIECEEFRVVLDANCYAVDVTQEGHKSGRALLKLDSSGNPILTAQHSYDALYKPDNTIEWDNSLTIHRNGLQFKQAHGGMLQGKAKSFNMITIGDENQSTNKFVYNADHNCTITPIGNCPKFDVNRFHTASWVKMFGKGITVTQTMEQPAPRSAENYLMFIFYSGASSDDSSLDRCKVYMQPMRGVDHFSTANAEIFDKGDILRAHLKRTIELN